MSEIVRGSGPWVCFILLTAEFFHLILEEKPICYLWEDSPYFLLDWDHGYLCVGLGLSPEFTFGGFGSLLDPGFWALTKAWGVEIGPLASCLPVPTWGDMGQLEVEDGSSSHALLWTFPYQSGGLLVWGLGERGLWLIKPGCCLACHLWKDTFTGEKSKAGFPFQE